MAVFRCKMCGSNLEATSGERVAVCDICKSRQTISYSQESAIQNLLNRAVVLRQKGDFDAAQDLYKKVVAKLRDDAEAYWGIVLSKYGVTYAADPKTDRRAPVCHRVPADSIFHDEDYRSALHHADSERTPLYQQEAEELDLLHRNAVSIAKNETPYDVFICYKSFDAETKKKTGDSILAKDLADHLTAAGLHVFCAATTLFDKSETTHAGYIHAALHTARVMLVLGTEPDCFQDAWVKNDWTRYLALMENDKSKRIISCYRDMNDYDLPEEFSDMQALDMSKIDFSEKLMALITKQTAESPAETNAAFPAIDNMKKTLRRMFLLLEEGNFAQAEELCDRALDMDDTCAEAYLGKLMIRLKIQERNELPNYHAPISESVFFKKILAYGDEAIQKEVTNADEMIKASIANQKNEEIYIRANAFFRVKEYEKAKNLFNSLGNYQDAVEMTCQCESILANAKNKISYARALELLEQREYAEAKELLDSVGDYQDARERARECESILTTTKNKDTYAKGITLISQKSYAEAKDIFESLGDYRDASAKVKECESAILEAMRKEKYVEALDLLKMEYYADAKALFEALGDYRDASTKAQECESAIQEAKRKGEYAEALDLLKQGAYADAKTRFEALGNYRDASKKAQECEEAIRELEMTEEQKQELAAKKRKKKIITSIISGASLILAAVLAVAILLIVQTIMLNNRVDTLKTELNDPNLVFGDSEDYPYLDFSDQKDLYNTQLRLSAELNTAPTDLIIPDVLDGYLVSEFDWSSITPDMRASIRSITLPRYLRQLEADDLTGFSNLTALTISNYTDIALTYFTDCGSLTSVTIVPAVANTANFSEVQPNGAILAEAFQSKFGSASKIDVIISEGITVIGNYAFADCAGLNSIIIPKSVREIGDRAFINSSPLTVYYSDTEDNWDNVRLGYGNYVILSAERYHYSDATPTIYGNYWYYINGKPTAWVLSGSATLLYEENGMGYTVTGILDKNAPTLSIPATYKDKPVLSIAARAFANLNSLTSVVIPGSVTSIGANAFQNCIGLSSVTISNGVTSIGNNAFRGCSSLSSVTIPNSVTHIGAYAFQDCIRLSSITIPDSVTLLGEGVLRGCSSLAIVNLPSGIKSIPDYTFFGCEKLARITIPDGVIGIDESAFEGCSELAYIVIPNSVTTIDSGAFQYCISLESIVIGSAMNTIEYNAFYGCSLHSVYYVGTESQWNNISINDGALYSVTPYCYSETKPIHAGSYWRYVDGVPTPW